MEHGYEQICEVKHVSQREFRAEISDQHADGATAARCSFVLADPHNALSGNVQRARCHRHRSAHDHLDLFLLLVRHDLEKIYVFNVLFGAGSNIIGRVCGFDPRRYFVFEVRIWANSV